MFTEFDRLAMTRALALAERGLETTHPNPRVGCVLAKGDRIIGEGWHERAGEPHAEIMALRSAKEPVAGATAYVTLEPCSHHGRTPPCANALIEARIARVVFAVQDPNPRVSGQGADALLRAGITVEAGLLQSEATELNIGFMKRMKEGLPWVRVKLAMSLDGRTALANGASQWITGEPARADVQRWRARCSAVMTGVGTVLADDPLLNVRLQGFKGRQPLRVVLDARLRSPPGAKMFASLAGVGAAGAAKAGGVGGQAGAAVAGAVAGGGARVGVANVAAGMASAAGVVGGPVLIFAAADGGFAAHPGVGRGAVISDPSTLSDDMAELVNAFETSPTAVSARADTVAGPVSMKAEPRATLSAATSAPAGAAAGAPASMATEAAGVLPPVLAAAGDSAGVAPTSDDATWAGAALSGAVPVKRHSDTVSNVANSPVAPTVSSATATAVGAPTTAAHAATSANGADETVAPPVNATAGANSTTTSAPATTAPTSAVAASTSTGAVSPAGAVAGASHSASAQGTPVSNASAPSKAPPLQPAAPAPTATAAAQTDAPAAEQPHGLTSAQAPATAVAQAHALPSAQDPAIPAAKTAAPMQSVKTAAAQAPGGPVPTSAAPAQAATPVRARPSAQAEAPVQTSAPVKPAAAKADSAAAFQARKMALAGKGVRIEEVPADEGFLDLFAVLKKLGDLEVNEVLVEAGPTLAGQLLTTFFVDELLLYVAPKLIGPQGRPLVNLPELQSLQDAWGFSLFDAKRFGDDLRLRMRPK